MGVVSSRSESKDSKQAAIQNTFVRIEDKFLVPKALIGNLKSLVSEHCAPAYAEAGTNYTLVESLYFDSSNLDLFQHHFSKILDERFKLRVRRYAPNGNWDEGAAFLEAKTKIRTATGSICSKKRFRIDSDNLKSLIDSGELTLTRKVTSLNPNMSKSDLLERLSFVNEMVHTYHLVPQLRVRYERLAFEGEGVRVTFDKNIEFKNMHEFEAGLADNIRHQEMWNVASGMKQVFSNHDYFVCEVKYSDAVPQWLQNYFHSHNIQKVSFSKYCWGLTNLIDRAEDSPR